MNCKMPEKSSLLKIAAVAAGAVALIAAAAVFIKKLVNKKRCEECYIECDCDDNFLEDGEETEDEEEELYEE